MGPKTEAVATADGLSGPAAQRFRSQPGFGGDLRFGLPPALCF